MKNAISWFEIPTTDINRAQQFYEFIFNMKMSSLEFQNIKMRMFPIDNPMEGIGGTLVQISDDFYKPSATDGPLIYLDGNPDLQIVLNRVEEAGGKILVPKTTISDEYGDMAVFLDTEGNRIALHNIPAKYQNA
ncbi:MAG: VOC family protein [Chitinophagaceae bacterium]|nr:VOC family protein [Chitinophagaceae bacterium]MBK8606488.1 VOC family protein [Chitinophagaceae bacterium]MBP6476277.1 VOC family protein [Chitinophagaceae bacterium]MBP7108074.1 VOC family protein [Chitinophagaceae bacterium]MBP7313648.1 VOC family protein [Chitinophagaceae bacterium]